MFTRFVCIAMPCGARLEAAENSGEATESSAKSKCFPACKSPCFPIEEKSLPTDCPEVRRERQAKRKLFWEGGCGAFPQNAASMRPRERSSESKHLEEEAGESLSDNTCVKCFCSVGLQADIVDSSRCPPEGGRYRGQNRVLTQALGAVGTATAARQKSKKPQGDHALRLFTIETRNLELYAFGFFQRRRHLQSRFRE